MAEGIRVTTGAPWSASAEVGRLRVSCASFEPGYAIPSHYHDAACLSVIVEGGFHQAFPRAEYECPPGGVLVKPAGERHVDRWGTVRTRHVIIEPIDLGRSDDPGDRVFREVGFRLDPRAAWLSRRVYEEFADEDDLSPLAIESLALELVVLAGRSSRARRHDRAAPAWLRRSREYLSDAAPGGRSIGDVAALVGVHPSRLAREFRRCFGVSPSEYVRQLRVERARSDLERSRDALSTIALRNGYADQSHLTRDFRRAMGLTPAAYRRARGTAR